MTLSIIVCLCAVEQRAVADGCTSDAECKGGRICDGGTCAAPPAATCAKDVDCPNDEVCDQGRCARTVASPVAPPVAPPGPSPARSGLTWDAAGSAGVDFTTEKTLSIGETAAIGTYLTSSATSSFALQVMENVNVVLDDQTLQYGFVAVGVRRLSVQRNPPAGFARGASSMARVGAGLAFATDGETLTKGLALTITFGEVGVSGIGFHLGADVYFFDGGNAGRVSLGVAFGR